MSFKFVNVEIFVVSPIIAHRSEYPGTRPLKSLPTQSHKTWYIENTTHNTFTNFYLKDLTWSDNNNNMYLGPVVAAQQVLDPSPQTSYPRKEKKWGAHPLQPSLQESKSQGLGICCLLRMWHKVFINVFLYNVLKTY